MTRDYKARNNVRPRRAQHGSGFFWFVTGVVVGAFGVGLAWTLQEGQPPPPPAAPAAGEQRPAAKPRFDFYNILPEMEVLVPDEEFSGKPPTIPPKPKPSQKAEPASEPTPSASETTTSKDSPAADGNSYLLQVASYRTASDAERLKAQLALLGVQAQIQKVTINGKDTYHRVRAGPYKGKESANAARALLARNGLESIAIKLK